jgi:hypothetical protein
MAITLLPMPLRKAGIVAVLCAIMWIFNEILSGKNWFNDYRKETFIQLEFNAQVCRLEYCLNYLFNNKQPGIEVIDSQAELADPFYLYLRNPRPQSIEMPIRLNNREWHIMLNDRAHNAEERFDFTVYVPPEIALGDEIEARFRSVVNNAKTPGKKWRLIHNA